MHSKVGFAISHSIFVGLSDLSLIDFEIDEPAFRAGEWFNYYRAQEPKSDLMVCWNSVQDELVNRCGVYVIDTWYPHVDLEVVPFPLGLQLYISKVEFIGAS